MNGLIDIHTHLIPSVDDGAKTIDVSKSMIDRYVESGFSTVIATPHMPIIPAETYVRDVAQGRKIAVQIARQGGIEALDGVEVRLSPEIRSATSSLDELGLAGSRYVLVDFPSGSWPHYAEDTLFQVQMLGFTPILAHPERYGWSTNHRDTPQELVDRGVLLQVTLGSLVGAFGSNAKKISRELLRSGLVHFTATDAHSGGSRMTAGIHGIDWLKGTFGDRALEQTLKTNPSAVIHGGVVNKFEPGTIRRLWSGLDLRRLVPRF